jgi:hypothetical protein
VRREVKNIGEEKSSMRSGEERNSPTEYGCKVKYPPPSACIVEIAAC